MFSVNATAYLVHEPSEPKSSFWVFFGPVTFSLTVGQFFMAIKSHNFMEIVQHWLEEQNILKNVFKKVEYLSLLILMKFKKK